MAGCGDDTLGPSTATLPEATDVSPRRYLADSAALAAAVRDFSAALEPLSPVARPGRLRASAPDLREARDRAAVAAQRLGAARLEDQRLERQRERVAAAVAPVLVAMDRVVAAAEVGDARRAAAAATAFATAVDRLRASALTA